MITITPFIKSFMISFTPSSDLDIVGYKVFGVPTSTLNGATDFTASGANKGDGNCLEEGPDTMYTIPASAGEWMVKVAAYDTFGEDVLNYSAPHTFTVSSTDPLDMVPPGVPSNVAAVVSISGVDAFTKATADVSWNMLSIPEDFSNFILRFRVTTGTNDGAWEERIISNSTAREYSLADLAVNTQYDIQMSAVDRWSNASAWSLPALVISTDDTSAVSPVSGLSFTTNVNNITAVWNPSLHPAFTHYDIEVATSADFTTGLTLGSGVTPRHTFIATNGATYYVRVKVITVGSESIWSTSSNITTYDTLSANRIITGTLSAATTISVGDNSLKLDGLNKRVTVSDGTIDRVRIGNLGNGDYGINVRDSADLPVITMSEADGAAIQNASVENLTVGHAGILCGTGESAFKVWEDTPNNMNMFVGNVGGATPSYLHWDGNALKVKADIEMSANSTINWGAAGIPPNLQGLTTEPILNSLIQVGGRNIYMRSSGGAMHNVNYDFADGTQVIGSKKILIGNTGVAGDAYNAIGLLNGVKFPAGKPYTLSFWMRCSTASTLNGSVGLYHNTSLTPVTSLWSGAVTTSWQYVELHGITTISDYVSLLLRGPTALDPEYMEYDGIKVEEGNIATAWTPAPEDVQVQLDAIASDSILSKGEKPAVIKEWDTINGNGSTTGTHWRIAAAAVALDLPVDTLTAAKVALLNYLVSINYSTLTADSAISSATFKQKFMDYYDAYAALQKLITDKAATLSTWGGVTGTGKPADNATANRAFIQVSTSTPVNPQSGDTWYKTDLKTTWVYSGGIWTLISNNFNIGDLGGMVLSPSTPTNIGSNYIYTGTIATDKLIAGSSLIGNALIGNAAIHSANIDNGAIQTAHIGNAQVGTLQIAGDAVIVPVFDSGISSFAECSLNISFGTTINVLMQGIAYCPEYTTIRLEILKPGAPAWIPAGFGWEINSGGYPGYYPLSMSHRIEVTSTYPENPPGVYGFRLYNSSIPHVDYQLDTLLIMGIKQ